MIYKIILGKFETNIDEEDKNKIVGNIDKSFIILKSGEVINPSFVQGIIIDWEATRDERKQIKMEQNTKELESPRETGDVKTLLQKYKPKF